MLLVENATINPHGPRLDPIGNKASRNIERSSRFVPAVDGDQNLRDAGDLRCKFSRSLKQSTTPTFPPGGRLDVHAPDVRLVGDLQHRFSDKTGYPNKSVAIQGSEDGPVRRGSESACDFFQAQIDLFLVA